MKSDVVLARTTVLRSGRRDVHVLLDLRRAVLAEGLDVRRLSQAGALVRRVVGAGALVLQLGELLDDRTGVVAAGGLDDLLGDEQRVVGLGRRVGGRRRVL